MFAEFKENGGFGRVLDSDRGYFNSWHHSLFYSLFMRLKYSKRRTMDPAQADLFIVPYDFTIHEFYKNAGSSNGSGSGNNGTCARRGATTVPCPKRSVDLKSFLERSEHFKRHEGADHVLINSLTSPYTDCMSIKKEICKQCLSTGYFSFPPVMKLPANLRPYEERDMSSFVSLPFPSYYHWHETVTVLPWAESRIPERTLFAAYAGSIEVMLPDHTMLRRVIVKQCQRHSKHCVVVDMHTHKRSNTTAKPRQRTSRARAEMMDMEPADSTVIMRTNTRAVFCFVPPGE